MLLGVSQNSPVLWQTVALLDSGATPAMASGARRPGRSGAGLWSFRDYGSPLLQSGCSRLRSDRGFDAGAERIPGITLRPPVSAANLQFWSAVLAACGQTHRLIADSGRRRGAVHREWSWHRVSEIGRASC